ncbi:MAG: helix-turn-helix transcriptional regulator [Paracoccaceae bacterium]
MNAHSPTPAAPNYVRPKDACRQLGGMGLSTLYAHIDRGMFPKPVALSRRFVVFPQENVTAIINARLAGKTDEDVRQLVSEIMEKRRA